MTDLRPGITISVVLYKNEPQHLIGLIESLMKCSLALDIYFIDNSPDSTLSQNIPEASNISYQWNKENLGYGRAHNLVMEGKLNEGKYHLAMNADIYFEAGTLEKLIDHMEAHEDTGLLLPKVLNPDGSDQPLFKLLPTPQDLIVRRFVPKFLKHLFEKKLRLYKMSFANSDTNFDAPYLSGCFMLMRKAALADIGLFDPRFFLYCEDVDLSRRIRAKWRTTYCVEASIYHYFYKGSYREVRLLYHHMISAVKYFNKYGWFSDLERDQINNETLSAFSLEAQNFAISTSE